MKNNAHYNEPPNTSVVGTQDSCTHIEQYKNETRPHKVPSAYAIPHNCFIYVINGVRALKCAFSMERYSKKIAVTYSMHTPDRKQNWYYCGTYIEMRINLFRNKTNIIYARTIRNDTWENVWYVP